MSRQASGIKAWVVQRVSAVYLGAFSLYVFAHFVAAPPSDYQTWSEWVAQPWVNLGWLLCVPMLLAHAWVGLRNILIDYVRPFPLRAALLTVGALTLLACGLWALRALVLVGLEG